MGAVKLTEIDVETIIGEPMENLVVVARDAELHVLKTSTAKDISVGTVGGAMVAGPYLPISSGSYDMMVLETSDFQSFTISIRR